MAIPRRAPRYDPNPLSQRGISKTYSVVPGRRVEYSDPRLQEIVRQAAEQFERAFPGFRVEAFSGKEGRFTNTKNHPSGNAIDVRIFDPNGNQLPNSPANAKKLGVPLGPAFRAYEMLAQTARQVQLSKYPDLSDQLRWGGYFRQGVALDLMHFDISGGKTALGSWETGLNSLGQKALKDAKTQGMGQYANQFNANYAPLGVQSLFSPQDAQRELGTQTAHLGLPIPEQTQNAPTPPPMAGNSGSPPEVRLSDVDAYMNDPRVTEGLPIGSAGNLDARISPYVNPPSGPQPYTPPKILPEYNIAGGMKPDVPLASQVAGDPRMGMPPQGMPRMDPFQAAQNEFNERQREKDRANALGGMPIPSPSAVPSPSMLTQNQGPPSPLAGAQQGNVPFGPPMHPSGTDPLPASTASQKLPLYSPQAGLATGPGQSGGLLPPQPDVAARMPIPRPDPMLANLPTRLPQPRPDRPDDAAFVPRPRPDLPTDGQQATIQSMPLSFALNRPFNADFPAEEGRIDGAFPDSMLPPTPQAPEVPAAMPTPTPPPTSPMPSSLMAMGMPAGGFGSKKMPGLSMPPLDPAQVIQSLPITPAQPLVPTPAQTTSSSMPKSSSNYTYNRNSSGQFTGGGYYNNSRSYLDPGSRSYQLTNRTGNATTGSR